MRTPLALAPLLLAHAALSQSVVVDAAGGPGSQFTSIAAAVAGVPDGATLLVRAGTYGPFTIDGKGIAVLAEPGTQITNGTVEVKNTAAGQAVVLRELSFPGGEVVCADCAGPLLLDRVQRPLGPLSWFTFTFLDCDQAFMNECHVHGLQFLGADRPSVTCTSSRVALHGGNVWSTGSRCIVATDSDIQVVDVWFAPFATGSNITPTIDLDSVTTLRVLGATQLGATNNAPIVGGQVRLGPNVVFTSTPTPLQPASLAQVPDELVTVTGGALGGDVIATMTGDPASLGLLLIGPTAAPFAVPGVFDAWWLAPTASAGLAFGVMSSPLAATVAIPTNQLLLGQTYGFQGLCFHATNGWTATTPARFVIR